MMLFNLKVKIRDCAFKYFEFILISGP